MLRSTYSYHVVLHLQNREKGQTQICQGALALLLRKKELELIKHLLLGIFSEGSSTTVPNTSKTQPINATNMCIMDAKSEKN
jgi:hypothetical protein